MTTDEIKAYYASLLIIQYFGLPKASATIKALVGPVIMDQLPVAVQNAYDLTTAAGVQLDVLGKYVGLSREGYDFTGPVTLDDTDYRQALSLKIAQNNSGSSLADIQNQLNIFFPGVLFVFDYANMHMSYMLDTDAASSELAEFFVKQHLLPKPMGVQLGALIYSTDIAHFFGMVTYGNPTPFMNSPFNTYEDYQSGRPWLDYNNAIVE